MHGNDRPPLPAEPRTGSSWRHRKRGHVYAIGGVLRHSETLEPMVSYYRIDDGSYEPWVRPHAEFMDGRFEPWEPGEW